MIRGIGIDVVAVNRMRRWLDDELLLRRYFADREREAIYERRDGAALSLAARFAAKEAFAKALGTGFRGFGIARCVGCKRRAWKAGASRYRCGEQALHRIGGNKLWLSLTHEREDAIAMVVIEG